MTTRTVKVGNEFKLCGLIWRVAVTFDCGNAFVAHQQGAPENVVTLTMATSEVMGCEWMVKKLTKEQAEAIKDFVVLGAGKIVEDTPYDIILKMVDSLTETE